MAALPGVQVPCGKLVAAKGVGGAPPAPTSLLYNEYIVYDTSQVQIRYLVQVKFDYDVDGELGFD